MSKQILSEPQPCAKCLKKYGPELTDWTPCKNCSWITKQESNSLEKETKEKPGAEKTCLECQEILNFLEPEKDKYLCGKVKCLRSYIQSKSRKVNS